ncbi:MAG: hypothetical protein JF570_07010, partial [Caulobacter sp.]|nr:hypothetical protein [Caulobacter sp.]
QLELLEQEPGVSNQEVAAESEREAPAPVSEAKKKRKHPGRQMLFDVLWSADAAGPFAAVNPVRLLSSMYLHAAERGFYRIRTTDLAGRELSVSDMVAAG